MVSTVISTTTTIGITAGFQDTVYVSGSGSILTTSGNAIASTATDAYNATVFVSGEIGSLSATGIFLTGTQVANDTSSVGLHKVTVQTGGIVSGDVSGIRFGGTFNQMTNLGSVYGETRGVLSWGSEFKLANTGSINGGIYGIQVYGQNSDGSTINGLNRIANTGTIQGLTTGLDVYAANLDLNNSGSLVGLDNGISITATGIGTPTYANITNTGLIAGSTSYWKAAIISDIVKVSLYNYGDIMGDVWLGTMVDMVKNGGTITGNVRLGDSNDTYVGTGSGSVSGFIDGGAGDDILKGSDAGDTMDGGAGDDVLKGRGGNDILSDSSGTDNFFGGSGDDDMTGGAGRNSMWGGRGDDTIRGEGGVDVIYGGNGNDIIFGGKGKDMLFGGNGDDVIDGGSKDDIIYGGPGNDTLTGGTHSDTFIFKNLSGNSTITDFTNGADKLDLSAFGASAADIALAATQTGAGTLIDFGLLGGTGSVFLTGFAATDLDASDFVL